MRADQRQLLVRARVSHRLAHRGVQLLARRERAPVATAFRHPGRMLEDGPGEASELLAVHRIQLRKVWHRFHRLS